MTSREHLFLAYNQRTYGTLADAWRSPRLQRYSLHDPAYWAQIGRRAEEGLIDIVFTGDSSAHADPTKGIAHDGLDRFTAWTALIEATEHPGFILTASTTYNDPFRLAERLLSLDHLSGGRLAWNVVTSHSEAAAANFGLEVHPDREIRYARGTEFVGLVLDLWDSTATGAEVDHVSEQFHVQGRLRIPRSAQGRPPVIRASTSRTGAELQGRYANGVFAADLTRDGAVASRSQVRADAASYGRDSDDIAYLSGLRIVLGGTESEARAKVADGDGFTLERLAEQAAWFGGVIGYEVTSLSPDEKLPAELVEPARIAALTASGVSHGFRESVLTYVRSHLELPLRELLEQLYFVGAGHSTFVGTPEQLADRLEDWFRAGAADGFVLAPDSTLETLDLLVDGTVPALQRKGIFKHEFTSSTFAGHLGRAAFDGARPSRFIADLGRRSQARAHVVDRLVDPRAERHEAAVPAGVAQPLTADALGDVPQWLALTEAALAQAIEEPDRLAQLPAGAVVILGVERAPGWASRKPEQALDPTTAAATLGLHLSHLRFVPVVAVEREHPWNLERTATSLQHWLRGRTGLLLTERDTLAATGRQGAQAWDSGPFAEPVSGGQPTLLEVVEVVRRLGESYPISALVADRERGVYARSEAIAPIDHSGRYRVAGPSAVPSSPYGRPLIGYIAAAGAEIELDAAVDVVITAAGTGAGDDPRIVVPEIIADLADVEQTVTAG